LRTIVRTSLGIAAVLAATWIAGTPASAREFDAYRAMIASTSATDADWARRAQISSRYVENLLGREKRPAARPIRSIRVRLDSRERPSQACWSGLPLAASRKVGDMVEITYCPAGMRALSGLSAVQTLGTIHSVDPRTGRAVFPRTIVPPYLLALRIRANRLFSGGEGRFSAEVFCNPFSFLLGSRTSPDQCRAGIDSPTLDAALSAAERSPTILNLVQLGRQMGEPERSPAAMVAHLLDSRLQHISDFIVAHEVAHFLLPPGPTESEVDARAAELIRRDDRSNFVEGVMQPSLSVHFLSALFSENRPAESLTAIDARVQAAICFGQRQVGEILRLRPDDLEAVRQWNAGTESGEVIGGMLDLFLTMVKSECRVGAVPGSV
jgi:hypothetical protein